MQIQEEKLNELLGKVVTEYGAAVMGLHVHIGDKLGLYRALGANGGLTSQQLAETTGTAERYVREWPRGGYFAHPPAYPMVNKVALPEICRDESAINSRPICGATP